MQSDNNSLDFFNELALTVISFPVKLEEEVKEVKEALDKAWDEEFSTFSLEELASEVFDVMQVCYSFLKTYFTEEEIEALNTIHLFKLRSRQNG